MHERTLLAKESVGIAHSTTKDATNHITSLGVARQLAVGNRECHSADVVCNDAHGDIHLFPLTIVLTGQLLDLLDERLEYIGIVVGMLTLQGAHQTLETHSCINDIHSQGNKRSVGLALELHEDDVPDLNDLRVVLIDEVTTGDLSFLFGRPAVEVNLGAGTARTRLAHFPEVIVLVAINDMVGSNVLGPIACGLIITGNAFFLRTFEHRYIQVGGVEPDDINEVFPRHINGTLLEVVAKGPVTEHLEHRVVVGIVAYLFQVVVLTADTQTLLRVCTATWLWVFLSENDILPLVHTSVGEHQCGVVFHNHRGGGYDGMSLFGEVLLKGLADFLCSAHIMSLEFRV